MAGIAHYAVSNRMLEVVDPTVAEWIENAFATTGKTGKGLADAMGISPTQVSRLRRGVRRLKAEEIPAVVEYFEVDTPDFLSLPTGPPPALLGRQRRGAAEVGAGYIAPRDEVPVFVAREASHGELTIDEQPLPDRMPRPLPLRNSPNGYILMVDGEEMVPLYRPGELALVSPSLPRVRGEDFLLRTRERGGRAIIRVVMKIEPDHWHGAQLDPKAVIPFRRSEWPIAHRIVGKFARI